MAKGQQEGGLKTNWREDTLWGIRLGIFSIHAAATPFRLIWTPLGWIGRRSFGLIEFAGIGLIYPLFGQWPAGQGDARIFNLSWMCLWIWLFVHGLAAQLLNRRNGVHSREHAGKALVGRSGNPIWPLLLVTVPARLFIGERCHGLTMYLTAGPFLYFLSYALVNLKMERGVEEIDDAVLAAQDQAARMRYRQSRMGQ